MSNYKEIAEKFISSSLLEPWALAEVICLYVSKGEIHFDVIEDDIYRQASVEGKPVELDKERRFVHNIVLELIKHEIVNDKIGSSPIERQNHLLHVLGKIEKEYQLMKQFAKIAIPKKLVGLRHKKDSDLLCVSQLQILSKGFRYRDRVHDLIIYPEGGSALTGTVIDVLKNSKGKLHGYVLPRYIGQHANYTDARPSELVKSYGIPFTKEKLANIVKKVSGVYKYPFVHDSSMNTRLVGFQVPLRQLEYVIKPKPSERKLTLSIEETIDIDSDFMNIPSFKFQTSTDCYVLHRLLHAEMRKDTLDISHLDVSYLYYDSESYRSRTAGNTHLKAKVTSATCKKKLFRLDGIDPDGGIAFDDFARIVKASFAGNPEIELFLKGE